MATDVPTFRLRFPEFSDPAEYPDGRIQLFLDDAILLYLGEDESRWCGKYDIAQAYLAAHLLTVGMGSELGDNNSKSGGISSKSAGGVSVSYATAAKDRTDNDQFFSSTIYGQQYLIIRNSCFVGVLVANQI